MATSAAGYFRWQDTVDMHKHTIHDQNSTLQKSAKGGPVATTMTIVVLAL